MKPLKNTSSQRFYVKLTKKLLKLCGKNFLNISNSKFDLINIIIKIDIFIRRSFYEKFAYKSY